MSRRHRTAAEQLDYLYALGSRPTGSATHVELVDRIAADLTDLGLEVHRDPFTFERWEVASDKLALTINGRRVAIASAWPYSGQTTPEGITAPLAFVEGRRKNWKRAAGHIAVVEVEHLWVPKNLLFDSWKGVRQSGMVSHPLISAELSCIDLRKARDAGVLAVIALWKGLPDGIAGGQYVPFTQRYQGLPAVWVLDSEREAVVDAARLRASATLVVDAVLTPGVRTETVWAMSPGTKNDETVLVVTHTDGVNAVQENGHIGVLALAYHAATNPHDRTIVFVFATGHLRIPAVTRHGQAITAWFEKHCDLWSGRDHGKRAVAGLAIEHLGAVEYAVDPATGRYGPTGRPELELLYATTNELAERVRCNWEAHGGAVAAKPGAFIHLGEGEPLFKRHIPTVALVTGPGYLMADSRELLVNVEVLTRQIENFRQLMTYFSAASTTKEQLGTVRPPGIVRKILAGLRALWFVGLPALCYAVSRTRQN